MNSAYPPPTTSPSSPLTVLLVEDEALIAEELRLTLEDFGYQVLPPCYSFAEGRAALSPAAPTRPDLVLLDLNLRSSNPLHNGLALAQLLRQQPVPPPFLFLTAYDDADTIRQAAALQPGGYLLKPVGEAPLFAAIQVALAGAASRAPAPASHSSSAANSFYVKVGGHIVALAWSEVMSLEAGKNYVTLRAPARRLVHALRGSLTSVLDQLVPPALHGQFLRVNRSTLLHAAHITAYDAEYVYCGAERFDNGHLALRQLRELPLAGPPPAGRPARR